MDGDENQSGSGESQPPTHPNRPHAQKRFAFGGVEVLRILLRSPTYNKQEAVVEAELREINHFCFVFFRFFHAGRVTAFITPFFF